MKKTRLLSLLTASSMVAMTLAGCSGTSSSAAPSSAAPAPSASTSQPASQEQPADAGSLVLYTSSPQAYLDVLIAGYEAATGVKVELVTAGTGELLKKIEAEGDNPLGDVLLGGTTDTNYNPNLKLFEEYVSPEDANLPEGYRNATGKVTSIGLVPSVLVVNTELIGDVTVEGYEDLLKPELKGRIASADPSKASSSFEHLVNQLYAMGSGDTDEGWGYISKFVESLDGKLLESSSAVPKGVADGEYAVGLTYESAATTFIANGSPVKAVYMKEGVICKADGIAIIKGAKNLDNAKKFIDYIIGQDFQSKLGAEPLYRRPVREDVPGPVGQPTLSEMTLLSPNPNYVIEHKAELMDHFKDIVIQ